MKKKELLSILGSLLVIVLSVSLAWFSMEILGKEKEVSVDSANLRIVFNSGTGTIAGSEIVPGWSSGISTFTVKNESDGTYKYNIVIKDLVNTFITKGYLVYKITSTDGGYNMSEFKDVPKRSSTTDTVLAHSVEIAKGKTHSYSIEFKYIDTLVVDQSEDMGKVLSGSLYIEKGTENIHGEYEEGTLGWQILNDNQTRGTRTSFSSIFTSDTTGTLFKSTESITGGPTKDVYYFAGNPTNNWVKFAGFYWRIIRTNHDGSIRLLYSGTSPDTTSGYIGTSKFNSTSNDSMYVGYMYGISGSLENNRKNTNSSVVKGVIDKWYSNNLTSYTKYLSTEAIYCNDRNVASGTYSAAGSERFNYMAYGRLAINKTPTYDCTTPEDAFSGSNAKAKLTHPIGLMTADEVSYAGGLAWTNNPSVWYYLNSTGSSITGSTWWWLLSPTYWNGANAGSFGVYGSRNPGRLDDGNVTTAYGVRPVISIKAEVPYSSGNGSSESPYEIVYN